MNTTNGIRRNLTTYDRQDGLGDIFAGICILFAGLSLSIDMPWFGGIMVPVLYPVWKDAKARIRGRRIEGSQSSAPQVNRERQTFIMLALLGGLTFILGLLVFGTMALPSLMPGFHTWLRDYFLLFLGGLAALLFLAVGAVIRHRRFYLYALASLAIFSIGFLFNFSFEITLTTLGAILLITGLFVLLRFLSEGPALDGN